MKKITEEFLKKQKFEKIMEGEYQIFVEFEDRANTLNKRIMASKTPEGWVAFYLIDNTMASNEMNTIEQLQGLLLSFKAIEWEAVKQ